MLKRRIAIAQWIAEKITGRPTELWVRIGEADNAD